MRERHEAAERKKLGLSSAAAPSSNDVHREGEHALDSPLPGRPPLQAREYPAILREYASSGFRDDPRDAEEKHQRHN